MVKNELIGSLAASWPSGLALQLRVEIRQTDGRTMAAEMKKYYLRGRILNLKPGGHTLSR